LQRFAALHDASSVSIPVPALPAVLSPAVSLAPVLVLSGTPLGASFELAAAADRAAASRRLPPTSSHLLTMHKNGSLRMGLVK